MRKISRSHRFKRSFAKHADINTPLIEVLYLLLSDQPLPQKYCDHALSGEFVGFRDCHIKPDLVLIYRKVGDDALELVDIGSHSQLFG